MPVQEIKEDIAIDGNFCLELRKRLNMSRERLASLLGTSAQTISRWETNKSKPNDYEKKLLWAYWKGTDKKDPDYIQCKLSDVIATSGTLGGIYYLLSLFLED